MQIRRRPPVSSVTVINLTYKIKTAEDQPNNILEEIVWHKETEVDQLRDRRPLVELKRQLASAPPVRNFAEALRQSKTHPALIAEVKKASPSKGVLREDFDPVAIAQAYEQGGATCLSVLTDQRFFQGSFENLQRVRQAVDLPLLCKDFILYPYQLYQARIHGADAALLIAAILSDQDLQYLLKVIKTLGMTALVEVHTLEELDRVLALDGVELIGINNRDLQTFTVDLQTTCDLLTARQQPLSDRSILVVSESGLFVPADLRRVAEAGAAAVLVGESLVKQPDPAQATAALLSEA